VTSPESGADETSTSTATLPPYRQQMMTDQRTSTTNINNADVDDDDDTDVEVELTARTAEEDISIVSQPHVEVTNDRHVTTSAMDVDAGTSSDVAADVEEVDDACLTLPEDFSVFFDWTEIEHVLPVSDSRGLVGDWTALMYRKFHGVYPTCAVRFRYNYCRKTNSRQLSSPFWTGKATCRTGNCISVTMTMPDEPVAG